MDPEIRSALKEHFGHETFVAGQEEVIGHLIDGRSAAAVFPTGGGKSLCYQLPALMLKGLTLVVSPLIALMKDQIDALQARGVAAARLDSTLSAEEYFAVMDGVRAGTLRLLYVAPERFNNERFRAAMEAVPIALFAVDEAHCISEWGHNFRPDYLKLALFARTCGAERILALTATATPMCSPTSALSSASMLTAQSVPLSTGRTSLSGHSPWKRRPGTRSCGASSRSGKQGRPSST